MHTLQLSSKAATVLVALLLAPAASAKVGLESDDEAEQGYLLGEDQSLTTHIPFSLGRAGGFYAKMLVTPWNPVNDNTPNGTIAGEGWSVEFFFLNDAGELLERDAKGQSVEPEQGRRVDSTPTDVIPLPAKTPYRLGVTVHMPADAAIVDGSYDIPVALVFRDLEEDTASASGAGLEQSEGFRLLLSWGAPLSAVATPGAPVSVEPVKQEGGQGNQEPAPGGNNVAVQPWEGAQLWIWALLGLLLILFMIRREYQLHRLRKDVETMLVGLEISGIFDYKAMREAVDATQSTPAKDSKPANDQRPAADIQPTSPKK